MRSRESLDFAETDRRQMIVASKDDGLSSALVMRR